MEAGGYRELKKNTPFCADVGGGARKDGRHRVTEPAARK